MSCDICGSHGNLSPCYSCLERERDLWRKRAEKLSDACMAAFTRINANWLNLEPIAALVANALSEAAGFEEDWERELQGLTNGKKWREMFGPENKISSEGES